MRIWAIADLHLSFGTPNKKMDIFGPHWERHAEIIASHWQRLIHPEDLILIPGDFSWAMRLEEVIPDLKWLDGLNGTKAMIKGNHDYWWGSLTKIAPILPPSIHLIQNNAFQWKDAAIGGARLWDTPEYSFGEWIDIQEKPEGQTKGKENLIQEELSQKLFNKELERLKLSLNLFDPKAKIRIAMTHYPPIGADLAPSRASQILENNQIQICVFGHLHNLKGNVSLFGEARGVRYVLSSSDYLRFQPIPLL